jgi:class 3 adenylate cyclase
VIDNEAQDVIAGHIEEFITGERQPSEPDGVLATVMFTDIVGSPQRAAEIGDSRWRQLLDDWYSVFRGREVDTAATTWSLLSMDPRAGSAVHVQCVSASTLWD